MHIVIIGNGISGITAARFIRKLSDHRITVISSESEFFFSRTALMYVYMGHMRFEDIQPYEPWFWKKNSIELLNAHVTGIDTGQKRVVSASGITLNYDKLILATGSVTAKYNWPGQDLKGVQGLTSYHDLQTMEEYSGGLHHAVIVGGGLIGIEMAEMFCSRNIGVTMLVREQNYCEGFLPKEEAQMVNREIIRHGVDLRLETMLAEIVGDQNGKVTAVITNRNERIACGFVGLTTGVIPNLQLVKETDIVCGTGILVDEFLQTNVPDVYAIGDCAELKSPQSGRKAIEPVWYTGRIMGETVAYNICGYHIPYEPGIWFNSAKFFAIEYQVYGDIATTLPVNQASLYWEHPDGRKSIRINFNSETGQVLGFNLMGIRYRQEVCEKWIAQNTPITEVLPQLHRANFDGEFSKTYEGNLIELYDQRYGTALRQRRKATSA